MQVSNPIPIKVESLGKKFILQQRGSRTLKSTVLDWGRGGFCGFIAPATCGQSECGQGKQAGNSTHSVTVA